MTETVATELPFKHDVSLLAHDFLAICNPEAPLDLAKFCEPLTFEKDRDLPIIRQSFDATLSKVRENYPPNDPESEKVFGKGHEAVNFTNELLHDESRPGFLRPPFVSKLVAYFIATGDEAIRDLDDKARRYLLDLVLEKEIKRFHHPELFLLSEYYPDVANKRYFSGKSGQVEQFRESFKGIKDIQAKLREKAPQTPSGPERQ